MYCRSAVAIGCMLMLTVYFFCVWTLVGLILEEQSDQDLHCLFSYMRAAVVVGCFHELISACLLGSVDPDQTDPRGTV